MVSLAMNLLVAGLAFGSWLRHSAGPPPAAERRLGFGEWAAGLNREDHRALRQAFDARGMDFRAARAAEMADRRELLAALRAEPFDPAAMFEVTDRITRRATERMHLGNTLIREHVIAMSDDRRRSFADRLEHEIEKAESRRRAHTPPAP